MEGETQIGNPLSTIYLDSTSTYGGLVWDGSHLIVGEMTGGHYELDTLNSNGSISSALIVPGSGNATSALTGVAINGNYYATKYIPDTAVISEFNATNVLATIPTFGPVDSVRGITYDGKFLWQASYDDGTGMGYLFRIIPPPANWSAAPPWPADHPAPPMTAGISGPATIRKTAPANWCATTWPATSLKYTICLQSRAKSR